MANNFAGFQRGMGMGGWLTNYKRFQLMNPDMRTILTKGDFKHFDSYITEDDVKYIASLGMDHIRLGFDQIVLEQKPYEYSEHIFGLIENFVEWCRKSGLNAILNLHKCEGNYLDLRDDVALCDSEELQDRFVAFWLEFERRFSDKDFVAFELLNESKEANAEKWNRLIERTVNAIREKNKTRKIYLGAGNHNSCNALAEMNMFSDENIAYTFHFYAPHEFTHQRGVLDGKRIFHNSVIKYPSTNEVYVDEENQWAEYTKKPFVSHFSAFENIDKEYLRFRLNTIWELQKKFPQAHFYCSEFGVIKHCDIKSRENWIRDALSLFKENNIDYCVWNYLSIPNDGNKFSLVDDDTRKILSDELAKIIRGDI